MATPHERETVFAANYWKCRYRMAGPQTTRVNYGRIYARTQKLTQSFGLYKERLDSFPNYFSLYRIVQWPSCPLLPPFAAVYSPLKKQEKFDI